MKNYLNYYSHVNNLHIFHKFINFIIKHSCALTLGRKLKLRSRRKVFKKFGSKLKDPKTGVGLYIPKDLKKKIDGYRFGINQEKILDWSIKTQSLREGPCVVCGVMKNIKIYDVGKHVKVKKVANFCNKTYKRVIAFGGKPVPLCGECCDDIHKPAYGKTVSSGKS